MNETTDILDKTFKCEQAPNGRHILKYREGARVFTDEACLASTCHWCGKPIRRDQPRSAWWWSA